MRSTSIGLACAVLAVACGGETGIIVAVDQDDSVAEAPEALQFVIGVGDGSGAYLRDDFEAEDLADVAGRDLAADPYELLLRDRGPNPPTSILVAVFATRGDAEVGFAATDAPIAFRKDSMQRYALTLRAPADGDVWSTSTGCVGWGDQVIASPTDRDCDGCDDVTGAGCGDECTGADDCAGAFGGPPCGAWECNQGYCDVACTDCTDGDRDGFGVGDGCAGPDCDDDDDTVFEGVTRACYSGPAGTESEGTCRVGSQTCRDGAFSICSGEVIPSGEACNGEDEDCDGAIDEDLGDLTCGLGACTQTAPACANGQLGTCTPGPAAGDDSSCDGVDSDCDGAIDEDCPCVLAGPGGDDSLAAADANVTPFETVQAAIDWAAGDASRPKVVCLAAATCGTSHRFQGEVVMRDGIQVIGRYALNRTRCGPGTTTIIENETAEGVRFPSSVQSPTSLAGVQIERDDGQTTAAGITVDGAVNVVLAEIEIIDQPQVENAYGVDVLNGAEVIITRSAIWGGDGSEETVGVRSIGSKPHLMLNCGDLNQGKCDTWCGQGTQRGIRGRYTDGSGTAHAVLLTNSPGAVIETSALCGANADVGAVVKVEGEAHGVVVRTSLITGWGATVESDGILMESCGGGAPWVVDNWTISAEGRLPTTPVTSVRAIGDCHPIIERNREITGGSEGGAVGATGVYCGSDGAAASRCVVLDNPKIRGSFANFPPRAIGVRCENGGCMRVERNDIEGFQGVDAIGLWLGATGALVANNRISGGCATRAATGVRADGATARLENNRIFAGSCASAAPGNAPIYTGLQSIHRTGPGELDVHSNHIDGQGHATGCDSRGVAFETAQGAVVGPRGVLRNNIILGGLCTSAFVVEEADAGADPRLFEHNDVAPLGTASALYVDEGTTSLTAVGMINALLGAKNNISVDPMQTGYPARPALTAGSACVDAGTPVGAPAVDQDGDVRDATPDIGPDEL